MILGLYVVLVLSRFVSQGRSLMERGSVLSGNKSLGLSGGEIE